MEKRNAICKSEHLKSSSIEFWAKQYETGSGDSLKPWFEELCKNSYQLTPTKKIATQTHNKTIYEPRVKKTAFEYAKTKTQISFAVTAKLMSVFVFATRIVQSLFYLNPKFQASSHIL